MHILKQVVFWMDFIPAHISNPVPYVIPAVLYVIPSYDGNPQRLKAKKTSSQAAISGLVILPIRQIAAAAYASHNEDLSDPYSTQSHQPMSS